MGAIFVIDATDRDNIDTIGEFQKILNDDSLRESIILIFINKQDLPQAITEVVDRFWIE